MLQKATNFFFSFFYLFRATPAAYGSSQARGRIGAAAAGLHHSHSNNGSSCLCDLCYSSQQCQILNPLSEARDPTYILVDTSRACNHNGNSGAWILIWGGVKRKQELAVRADIFPPVGVARPKIIWISLSITSASSQDLL